MAKLTIVFGVLLILLGAGTYATIANSEPHAVTSLIPAFFGIVLLLCGVLALTPDTRRRMLFMHVAVTVGLLGFLFPFARSVGGAIKLAQGGAPALTVAHPLAVKESMAMALLCLVFTALCVRSFIAARRARTA